ARRGKFEQTVNRAEAALEDLAVMAAQQRERQLGAAGTQAESGAGLLKEHDAHGLGGFTEDRFLRGQEVAGLFETHASGSAERGAGGEAEHAGDIHEGLERASFEPEGIGLLAGLFDDEIAEESQR